MEVEEHDEDLKTPICENPSEVRFETDMDIDVPKPGSLRGACGKMELASPEDLESDNGCAPKTDMMVAKHENSVTGKEVFMYEDQQEVSLHDRRPALIGGLVKIAKEVGKYKRAQTQVESSHFEMSTADPDVMGRKLMMSSQVQEKEMILAGRGQINVQRERHQEITCIERVEPVIVAQGVTNSIIAQNFHLHIGKESRKRKKENKKSVKHSIREDILGRYKSKTTDFKPNTFVETRAVKTAKSILEFHQIVIIRGNPGDGKTTIALFLMECTLKETTETKPILLFRPEEWINIKPKENYIIFLDDIYGQSNFTKELLDTWEPYFDIIWSVVEGGNIRLIITLRNHIYKQCQKTLGLYKIFNPKYHVDLTSRDLKLSLLEKKEILRKHIKTKMNTKDMSEADITEAAKASPELGFPYCCYFFVSNTRVQSSGPTFFKEPFHFLKREVELLKEKDALRYFILVFIMLKGGSLHVDELDPFKIKDNQNIYLRKVLEACSESGEMPLGKIRDAAESLCNGFLIHNYETNRFQFSHHSIFDAVCIVFGDRHPDELLHACSVEFLLEHIQTRSSRRRKGEIIVPIKRSSFKSLFERIVRELDSGDLKGVIRHQCFSDSTFVNFLLKSENVDLISLIRREISADEKSIVLERTSEKIIACQFEFLLPMAIANGHTEFFSEIYRKHLDYCQTEMLSQCLEAACFLGNEDIFKMISEKTVSIPTQNCLLAAALGKTDNGNLIQLVLKREGEQTLDHEAFSKCLRICIQTKKTNIPTELLSSNRIHRVPLLEPFIDACFHGDVTMYQNLNTVIDYMNEDMLICLAAYGGNAYIVKDILKQNESVINIKDGLGRTPLHIACMRSNHECVKLLLDAGADVTAVDTHGNRPIHLAASPIFSTQNLCFQAVPVAPSPQPATGKTVAKALPGASCTQARVMHLDDISRTGKTFNLESESYGTETVDTLKGILPDNTFGPELRERNANVSPVATNISMYVPASKSGNICMSSISSGTFSTVGHSSAYTSLVPASSSAAAMDTSGSNLPHSITATCTATTDPKPDSKLSLSPSILSTTKQISSDQMELETSDSDSKAEAHGLECVTAVTSVSDSYSTSASTSSPSPAASASANQQMMLTSSPSPAASASASSSEREDKNVDCLQECIISTLPSHGNHDIFSGEMLTFKFQTNSEMLAGHKRKAADPQSSEPVKRKKVESMEEMSAQKGESINLQCKVIELLCQSKTDQLKVKNDMKETVLHRACMEGNVDTVKFLIKYKLDIADVDCNGETALHKAAAADRTAVVDVLCKNKADVNAVDTENETPLMKACFASAGPGTVKVLLEHSANNTFVNNAGQTALHKSAGNRYGLEIVDLLLQAGMDNTVEDKDGNTAWDIADMNEFEDMADLLKVKVTR